MIARRAFIALLGGAAAWPLAARAQQQALPVVALLRTLAEDDSAREVAAFRKGLSETGYVEGQTVAVEYHWLAQYDRVPTLLSDLVRRRVNIIATDSDVSSTAAKAATATIPVVFGAGQGHQEYFANAISNLQVRLAIDPAPNLTSPIEITRISSP